MPSLRTDVPSVLRMFPNGQDLTVRGVTFKPPGGDEWLLVDRANVRKTRPPQPPALHDASAAVRLLNAPAGLKNLQDVLVRAELPGPAMRPPGDGLTSLRVNPSLGEALPAVEQHLDGASTDARSAAALIRQIDWSRPDVVNTDHRRVDDLISHVASADRKLAEAGRLVEPPDPQSHQATLHRDLTELRDYTSPADLNDAIRRWPTNPGSSEPAQMAAELSEELPIQLLLSARNLQSVVDGGGGSAVATIR